MRDLSQEDAQRLQTVMGNKFDLFDTNGEGVMDISELFSGLAVLYTLAIKSTGRDGPVPHGGVQSQVPR